MNATATVALAIVASVGTAAGVNILLQRDAPPPAGVSAEDLQRIADQLRAENRKLQSEIVQLIQAPGVSAPDRTVVPTVSDAQIEAAVARFMARRDGVTPAEAAANGGPFDVKAAHESLRATNAWENPAAWRKVQDAGHMDELIAEFEAWAKRNPNDPKAHMELANAYLAALQFDQTKWQLSIKADEAFDHVLTLDTNHWEARFSKAVSYSFWPDFLGKKKEAVAHFETLVEQQQSMPATPGQAQTYLFLGNLLEQRGERERAMEVWRQGMQRHPESEELRGKVGG